MSWKRKIAPFASGVLVGLLIGVAFFIFKINDWFVKLRDTANERITVIQQPVKTVEEKKVEAPPREKFRINLGKPVKVDYKEVDSIIKEDARINIATEELLTVKNVKVIKVADNNAVTDSAAANAEVNEPAIETLQVEFWKTPLNSKGYKFSRKKIMLYGFPDAANILLYEVEGAYFLRSSDQVFRLTYTAEFKQLEKVTDPDLLTRLS